MKNPHNENESNSSLRLDKWLWAARFFKTRSLAHEAIEGGKVTVDGVRAKASRTVLVGQEIRVTSPRGQMTITVTGISAKRGSATIASALYKETDESQKTRLELVELHKLSAAAAPSERPNSQDRRKLRRIKEEG